MFLSGLEPNLSIVLVWVIFYAYWLFSFLYEFFTGKYKKTEKSPPVFNEMAEKVLLGAALILVVTNIGELYYPLNIILIQGSVLSLYVGFIIALFGIVFAIWARVHLSSNWSDHPVLKKDQTITRTGPYSIVRHPIYVGVTLGIIGSAIISGNVSGIVAIILVLLFSYYRITVEEKLMKQKFGKEYIEYSKEVKAFVPGIL